MMNVLLANSNREYKNNVDIMGVLPENTKSWSDQAVHFISGETLLESRITKR